MGNTNSTILVPNRNPNPPIGIPRRRIPRNERRIMGNNRILPQHIRTNPIPPRQRNRTTKRAPRQTHNQNMPKMRQVLDEEAKFCPRCGKALG